MSNKYFLETIGWYGTVAIVGAYFLNSFSFLAADTIWYQLLNVTGAIGIAVVSYKKRAYQPMMLNVVWTIIGAIAFTRLAL